MILAVPNNDWNSMANVALKFEREAFMQSPDRVRNPPPLSLIVFKMPVWLTWT